MHPYRTRFALLPCLGALTLAALSVSAAAQVTSAQQSAIRSNCRSDFMSKCSGVQPGGKDALMCLQRNVDSLSGGCQTAVRATIPAEPKMAAPPAAPPPPAAAAAPPPPPAATQQPATIVSAPPPKAQTAKKPLKKPATASVAPPPPPPAPPPPVAAPAAGESGPVPGGLIVSKACARYIIMHCPGMGLDMGRKVACLVDYVNSGAVVGPRCKGALALTGKLR